MLATYQEFKFGSSEKKLNLILSKVPHEPKFIYLPAVLKAFKIPDVEGFEADGEFEADGVTIDYMRDDNGTMYLPRRIPCHPGCVIEVVYDAALPHSASLASTIVHGSFSESVDLLGIKSEASRDMDLSEPLHLGPFRKSTMQIQEDMKVVTDAMVSRNRAGKELDIAIVEEQLPVEYRRRKAIPDKLDKILDQGQAILSQGATTQQIAREVWELQKQMNDRLILIQSKTEAILTQNYELLEYTIPRLFIVLPETTTSWDSAAMFRTKFRLHFICECGEHTKPAKDSMAPASKIPHELHLAKHEGYVIRKPTELFKKYGPFLMVMLEMIKQGTGIVGSVVSVVATIDKLTSQGIEYSLEYLEKIRVLMEKLDGVDIKDDAEAAREDLTNYLAGVEGLEGAELRQLGSYLEADSSDNLLGNMYRITTRDGYVKWVCLDHYRASYQEKHAQKLRDVVKLAQGEFDEQLGRIEIVLESTFAAAEFYNAVSKAKGVLELIIDCAWECTTSDLEQLEAVLMKSRVSILRLDLRRFRTGLGSKLLSTSAQCEALVRITEHSCMRMVHIVLTEEFIKLFNLQTIKPSHLCKLSFKLTSRSIGARELGRLVKALKTNSTLTTLDLSYSEIGDNGAQALSEALKTNSSLTTLSLQYNKIGSNGAQALSEALKTNSTLAILDLKDNSIGFGGAVALLLACNINITLTSMYLAYNKIESSRFQAVYEAFKTNSTITSLDLPYFHIGDDGAQALSEALRTNSSLTSLNLQVNSIESNGAQVLSEALKINSTLTTLSLMGNSIEDNGAQALSNALQPNSTLINLNLIDCSIGDNGAQALSEALKANSTLVALNLGDNKIGSNGAQALSKALKTNSTLTTLNLRSNAIGSTGAQALSGALKTNMTLTTLNLYSGSIGDSGAQALSEALKTNSTLTTLNLQDNKIGDKGDQALSEAFKTNSTLTTLSLGIKGHLQLQRTTRLDWRHLGV